VYNTSDDHKTIGEYLQNSWKRIGIDVRLQNLEWKVVNENLHKGQFQLARYGWIGDYMDPQTFLDMWITGAGNNTAQWSNAEYDELIQQAIRESDPMKRMEHFAAAEEILMGEYVLCPIYFYVINYYETDEVEGIERSTTMNIRFDRARWKK
jgi:oligopeptide transport system substrate-binding protein